MLSSCQLYKYRLFPDHGNKFITNLDGSFECLCHEYFVGNGINCDDIDECSKGTHECNHETHVCMNREGSYKCEPLQGQFVIRVKIK